jgi:hypothetical protein
MIIKNKIPLAGSTVLFSILLLIVFVLSTGILESAESRDRGSDTTRRSTGTSPPAPPSPALPPSQTTPSSGGINSSTSIVVDTGNNEGGTVVTGDESGEVFEVNIGPANNTEPSVVIPAPVDDAPLKECDRRTGLYCETASNDRNR